MPITHIFCSTRLWATLLLLAATLGFQSQLFADQVQLDVGVANPTMLASEKSFNYFRISLTGFEITEAQERPPVNVAIVIDNSGSMRGSKIAKARQAAIAAINRLEKDDVVSVVLYNSSVQVLVPATKAADREHIVSKVDAIRAYGGTALFAGVSKGAAEVRKFLDKESVNRIILLSDGRANVGPRSPRELERLGLSLVKEGISVSALGLGLSYNEDLMSSMASAGNGNHVFVEEEEGLVAVFNAEFNDILNVVAGDFKVHARFGKGVRPIRVLGTNADIMGRDIYIPLAQLYSGQQRYYIVEVEVGGGAPGTSEDFVSVDVEYQNLVQDSVEKLLHSEQVRFSESAEEIMRERDLHTYVLGAIQIANQRNMQATELRDDGKIEEAKEVLIWNVTELEKIAQTCRDDGAFDLVTELEVNIVVNQTQAEQIEAADWNRKRKSMRAVQNTVKSQQTRPSGWSLPSFMGGASDPVKGK